MTEPQCPRGGRPAAFCCVGTPWENPDLGMQLMYWGEPLYPSVIEVAAKLGLDPHDLAGHVEGEHGWEPHNAGYDKAVEQAAACLLKGSACSMSSGGWDAALSWLHAQLDTEARVARAAGGDTWRAADSGIYPEDASRHPGPFAVGAYGHLGEEYGAHIARQSPRAVLRRVESDRLILAMYGEARDGADHDAESEARFYLMCDVVKAMAHRFVDLPGFPEVLRMDATS